MHRCMVVSARDLGYHECFLFVIPKPSSVYALHCHYVFQTVLGYATCEQTTH